MITTPEDVLQQELLKERAEVLRRAGDSVDRALIKLRKLGESIEGRCHDLHPSDHGQKRHEDSDSPALRRQLIKDINKEINSYNRLRDYTRVRYHYLIVTREAMGLRKHQWVEDVYLIPPKKKPLRES
jgi:hypothetical protein